ncbi:MAG: hypothetical protein HZA03_05315 [Nitrospinae bacterium]|nr:hypothetical protein [Nitrospinota bacterium]
MKSKYPEQMSALCVAQPWASCIFEHGKNVENRSANLRKRGTIAIYASKSRMESRFEYCKEKYGVEIKWDDVKKGHIIGFIDIIDVIKEIE